MKTIFHSQNASGHHARQFRFGVPVEPRKDADGPPRSAVEAVALFGGFLFFAGFFGAELTFYLPSFVTVVRTTSLEVSWLLYMKDEEERGP